MNSALIRFLLCIPLLYVPACVPQEKDAFATAGRIAVHWELKTNFTSEKDVFQAQFELVNNSDIVLTGDNWTLFFNMSPRPLLENTSPQPARLQHINGDWYKLVPAEKFSLPPGDTVVIEYRGVEAVIKETDRPLGLYFVFYNSQGGDAKIVNVTNYTWTPFTRPDQVNRNADDAEPVPSPAWMYSNNLAMSVVPASQMMPIVPSPAHWKTRPGTLEISNRMAIVYDSGLENEAAYLARSLKDITGREFSTATRHTAGTAITLKTGAVATGHAAAEAYALTVAADGITITGSDAAGVFYGVQSLRALIPLEAWQNKPAAFSLPCITVRDAPRFAFRGLHLDVSRNFQTKETILRTLDLLAFYKINRFLFYTTEDEGWRLEIRDLPELTTVGAQRRHTAGKEEAALHPAYGSGPFAQASGTYGHGYYSRNDFIEILKYAHERHIKVIPELNFPGHARAAIKAMEARYERLMKEGNETGANEYRLIDPEDRSVYLSAQGYTDNVVCVARESAFHFYEKVVDEIAAMFADAGLTLDEFHTGGDEVPEGAWTASPLAGALLKENPAIGDPKNLQAYFFNELVKRLKARNIRAHGWEEVALVKTAGGAYAPNPEFVHAQVVPYIWNNLFDYPDLGYRLANAGYNVVLCNVSNFYFDLAYNKDPQEPGLYWAGFVNVRDAWAFAPYNMFYTTPADALGRPFNPGVVELLKPAARANILGVEAQLWSETVKGRQMLEYYMLPKLTGFAESAWAPARAWETTVDAGQRERMMQQQWNTFANTLARKEMPRLAYMNNGYHYRVPPPGAQIKEGMLRANVEYPGLVIRYTTDGSEPTQSALPYTAPVPVGGEVRLKSFDAAGSASRTVVVTPAGD